VKRILALDGGGIRGVFSLEILLRIEALLREYTGSSQSVLADHFDFFAGTSTGAIIATCLCWGMAVQEILELYAAHGRTMFQRVPLYRPLKRFLISRYDAQPLSELLQKLFSDDGNGEEPALLDSARLRKLLLVVMRNHSTGSAWPVTNNPRALFNDPALPHCNLKIPIWRLVRASAAAPVYFDAETIPLGDQTYVFVDGAITPYNNPGLIAALTATLPAYRIGWPVGPEHIRVISIGTLRFSSALPQTVRKLWLGHHVANVPPALMDGIAWEQDLLCRCLGQCIFGEDLDLEIGDLRGQQITASPWFSYVRYNQSYKGAALQQALQNHPQLSRLDGIDSIPGLREIGRSYAQEHVRLEHLI
jgi:hypothetical protein